MQRKQHIPGAWEQKQYNRNVEWINNMKKESQRIEEDSETEIYSSQKE